MSGSILNGLLSLVFGVLVLLDVIADAEALMMEFGFYAIIYGACVIALSFRVKKLHLGLI